MQCFIIFPNTLVESPISKLKNIQANIQTIDFLLVEEPTYFTKFPMHKMKLMLHRASMKYYQDYLAKAYPKNKTLYLEFNQDLKSALTNYKIVHCFDPVDFALADKIKSMTADKKLVMHDSPIFMESIAELTDYYNSLKSHKNYLHDRGFYKWQRRRYDILMKNGEPLYDSLSFDKDNRHAFDDEYVEPKHPPILTNKYIEEARQYVNKHWPNNFGQDKEFIWPVTHKQANDLFVDFIANKLKTFGKYEDAVSPDIPFGSHSILSAAINTGLIKVDYILAAVLKEWKSWTPAQQKKNISSVEGFIRQIIGWRSYMRFIYHFHGAEMINSNRLDHTNKLDDSWYAATTQIHPIDVIIKKVQRTAYAHHTERLMYLGNFALLCFTDPKEIYKWFMVCFIDSYEWVMVPNVMGMSQWSSNISMMTRPYFSSSNYIKTLGNWNLFDYKQITLNGKQYYWNEVWDALYYNFISKQSIALKKYLYIWTVIKYWENKSKAEQNKIKMIADAYMYSMLYAHSGPAATLPSAFIPHQ